VPAWSVAQTDTPLCSTALSSCASARPRAGRNLSSHCEPPQIKTGVRRGLGGTPSYFSLAASDGGDSTDRDCRIPHPSDLRSQRAGEGGMGNQVSCTCGPQRAPTQLASSWRVPKPFTNESSEAVRYKATLLLSSAKKGRTDEIKSLFADLDKSQINALLAAVEAKAGNAPLALAAMNGKLDTVKLLLSHDAPVHALNGSRETALGEAPPKSDPKICQPARDSHVCFPVL
jgi:hypothetical protein